MFDQPHNLLTFGGDIAGGVDLDHWQCGIRFGNGSYLMGDTARLQPDADTNNILNDLQADLTTWWQSFSAVSNVVTLKWLKFNAIGVNGRYSNQEKTFVRDFPTPLKGQAAGNTLPPQCAIAVTFRTAAARGLASRGRIFLPPFGSSVLQGQGRLNPTNRDQIATATATLLTNLGNWPGSDDVVNPGRPCVMSDVREGATRRINRVDVGDVFDTQRSRRRSYTEVRSAPVGVVS